LFEYELALLRLQLQMEDSFLCIAVSTREPSVIFFDRGLLDIKAYLPPELWERLLLAVGLSEDSMCRRYDSVLHLVTAAEGAEEHYRGPGEFTDDLGVPVIRRSDATAARTLDRSILAAWRPHPRVSCIDNRCAGGFAEKRARAQAAIRRELAMAGRQRGAAGAAATAAACCTGRR